jgi:hypothetical protein
MTKRLALTPAVGLFAGLSVVSYGAVSMLLTGVHGIRQASTNPCTASATASPTATATTKALVRPAARTGTRAGHPAGMPVLLADTVRLAPASKHGTMLPGTSASNQPAGQATASQSPSATQSAPPLPSTQPSSTTSPPPLPQPSPGTSATPGAGGLPQPAPATTVSSKKPITPGGTPIITATPTTTATPTPTATATTPPPGTLCIQMQTLNSVSAVDPGTTVGYAIWVWLTSGTGGTAKISLSAKPSSLTPTFSVCSPSGKSTCTVGGLDAGAKVQVQAQLAAPARPTKHFTVTATATSTDASNSATASAIVDIKPKNPSPTSSPTPNPTAGDGGILPPAQGLPSGTSIPGLGPSPATGDLGSAFPPVSPSPSSAAAAAAARHGHTTRTIDVSAGLPLTVRLIGGQVIGLAVLAAAVTIAVARLSLRRQPPRHGEDSAGS